MSALALTGGNSTITLDYIQEATLPVCNERGKRLVNELM